MYRKVLLIVNILTRIITISTAIWLVIELIYFKLTGKYIVYYQIWLNDSNNFYETIRMVNYIYNVQQDKLSHLFTIYIVPSVLFIAFLRITADVAFLFRNKEMICVSIVDAIAFLIIGVVFFIY